ncbi:MAG: lipid-binding SYLF domain-containing protein [Cephaloticoccus sp.]|nr:lipid-binding SYLF domain-containing protein [Cephaloticoccus sp.]MCF7761232.1 lipid-binding SYLF domain-containing protein [Cephaloticoccus sp.]
MKKFFSFSLLAAILMAPVAANALPRSEYVERVETCEAVLQQFMASPETAIPADVLRRARGIIIVSQIRAGLMFGVKDGFGIIMVRRPDNTWSVPALLAAGEGSFGIQLGVSANETIYILTDDATPRLLFNQRFHVGVDAKAVAGPKAASNEHSNLEILTTPVLVYDRSKGLYAGASVKAGYLTRNDDANRSLYSTNYTLPEILYSNWVTVPDEVKPLINYVSSITN